MNDEQNQEALKEGEVETPEVESPATEETPVDEVAEAEAAVEESSKAVVEEEVTEPTEEGKSKKGAKNRIQDLVGKTKDLEEDNKSLSEQIEELTSQVGSGAKAPTQTPQIEPGAEITPEQYQQDVAKQANAVVDLRIQQERLVTRVNKEADEVISKYDELNPDKKELFNRDLSDSITEASLAYVRANPTKSLTKFVDGLMKPYKTAIEKETGKASEQIAKQVSQQATRPSPAPKGDKSPDAKSIKELEDSLGIVY